MNPFKKDPTAKARQVLISQEDSEFIAQVYSDYEASKEKKPVDDWQKYDEYVEDNQWNAASAKDEWKPQPQVNVCFKTIRSIHANSVSGKTSINATAKKPGYEDYARYITDMFEVYWDELDMDQKVSEAEWIRPKIGTVIFKSPWNPKRMGGDGDIDCFVVHPANVFIDANITNPFEVQQAECIDFAAPKTIKYIIANYSKEADKRCKYTREELKQIIVPENSFSDTEIYGDSVTTSTGNVPTTITGSEKTYRAVNTRERVTLHEYWYRDDNYKLQIAWVAGYVILKHTVDDPEMKKNGFYKHGRYPLVVIPYIQKDKRLWGRSELQSLVSADSKKDGLQDIINKMVQDYLVNLKLVGQGQVKYRHGAVKNPEKLTGEGGLIIPCKNDPNTDVVRDFGRPMSGILRDVEVFLTHVDRITNQWDVTQGRSTPYTKTAGGTLALLEQAMRPQNDVINTLNFGLRELAELWIAHLAEFVNDDREFVKRDAQGNPVSSFMFNPSQVLAAPKRLKTDNGYIDSEGTERLYFKIRIDVGASLALTKAYLVELGVNLFQNKAIDIEGLYNLMPEFPGKQDTLERLKAMQGTQGQVPVEQQVDAFLQSLPPEIIQMMQQMMSEEEMLAHLQQMMQMDPEMLQQHMAEMMTYASQLQSQAM